jgi:hypothetical protein
MTENNLKLFSDSFSLIFAINSFLYIREMFGRYLEAEHLENRKRVK